MSTPITVSKTQVGAWSLAGIVPNAPTEGHFDLDVGGTGGESTFSPDLRVKVDPIHFRDGGKYRSIVKLMMQYKNQEPGSTDWGMGTGWLIAPDLLVTAGHCAYDWGNALGPVVTVKAFIGYSGKASAGLDSVQFRMGKKIITTARWLQSEGTDRKSDVAFIQLNRPFTGALNTFSYEDTPVRGAVTLGVVGYPGDKAYNGEKGAEMYEQFVSSNYDIEKSQRHMLEYKISTFAGQSGSPVLRVTGNKLVSIGAHVYGGGLLNSASTIAGAYGNDFQSMRAAFIQANTKVTSLGGVDVFETSTAATQTLASQTSPSHTLGVHTSEEPTESFMDIFHQIGKAVLPNASTALSTASPFLGPIGPIAAIGGIALGTLGNMCESSFDASTGAIVPTTTPPHNLDGCAQRAVMGEAAFQTIQKLDPGSEDGAKILHQMEAVYRNLEPSLKLAPKLRHALTGPSLRMAIEDITKPKSAESTIEIRKQLTVVNNSESFMDDGQKAFAEALINSPTLVLHEEESFFGDIGSLIKMGTSFATPLLKKGAQFGLSKLAEAIGGQESAFDDHDPMTDILFKRAIMGEAALQVITKLPPKKLETLPLYDHNDELSTEGFFDSFKSVVQSIGRKVVATAPSVINAVAPIAINLLQNVIKPEDTRQSRGLTIPSGIPKKRSTSRFRKAGAVANGLMTAPPMPVQIPARA